MNISKQQNEGMTSRPSPFVVSYAGQKEFITINFGIERQTAKSNVAEQMQSDKTEAYRCATLSLSHEGRMTAGELMAEIVKADAFSSMTPDFLKQFSIHYGITDYDSLTAVLISGKYSYPEELSCHRKALLGDIEPLNALNDYVEQCKALAQQCFKKEEE